MVAQKCILLYTHVHRCAVSVFACVTNLLQKVEGETEGDRERESEIEEVREKLKAKIVHVFMHMPIVALLLCQN